MTEPAPVAFGLLRVGDADSPDAVGGRHFFSGRSLHPVPVPHLPPAWLSQSFTTAALGTVVSGCHRLLGLLHPGVRRSFPHAPAVPQRSGRAQARCLSSLLPQATGSFPRLPGRRGWPQLALSRGFFFHPSRNWPLQDSRSVNFLLMDFCVSS